MVVARRGSAFTGAAAAAAVAALLGGWLIAEAARTGF
jgi:hypothetical protein